MKTNNNNTGNNRPNESNTQQQVNHLPEDKNMSHKKGEKTAYIKNMPPIDGARPGVL